ncbi:MAG TPA: hypothetical protein VGW80_01570 [Solirubrobacterales bacterium]|jgi:hypothetical protein|nr:hypothetical protein [Solirubrobacterales bacterium]
MLGLPLTSPHSFYEYTIALLPVAFGYIKVGHHVLDLLRDLRAFRDRR